MKKYAIKATALAIGALVGGGAFASVNFAASPFVATTDKFASELDYSSTNKIASKTAITTNLGFGMSAGQIYFIRVDLTGAKLAVTAATNGTDAAAGGSVSGFNTSASTAATVAVASGGQAGDTYVIYSVTAGSLGEVASAALSIVLPSLNVTNSNASSVSVNYALYDTGPHAVNQTAGSTLSTQSGALFGFGASVAYSAKTASQEATVATLYKNFGTATAADLGPKSLGGFALAVASTVSNASLAAVLGTGTKVTFNGDLSWVGTGGKIELNTDSACSTTGTTVAASVPTGTTTAFVVAADKKSAVYTTGANASTYYLCVTTDGKQVIPTGTVTATFTPTAGTGGTAAGSGPTTTGTITHDGAELQAPFATIHPDYLSRIVLTSQYSSDASVTFSVINESGATCATGNTTATLKAGTMLVVNTKDICPSISTGTTRLAVNAVIAAPADQVHGVFNVMNYNQTTGATNSLITYPMVRKTQN